MTLNGNKLGWITRIKLCWRVLTRGTYDPDKYRTRHAQKQWRTCEQRRRDLDATIRPKRDCPESEFGDQ